MPASDGQLLLATWNINSIRLRVDRLRAFADGVRPDLICLQEIKCAEPQFPARELRSMGYAHLAVCGQKAYHGVAIASRRPFERIEAPALCHEGHARILAIRLACGLHVHNLYVPAGGDEPDPDVNPKFAHKLDFLSRMRGHYQHWTSRPLLLVGDLNVAPHENDVWSHRQLLNVVSHTPTETDALARIVAAGGFCDIARAVSPAEKKLYSWWSYRARDWRQSNRGRRLDHIWANGPCLPRVDMESFAVHVDERGGDKPSDHVPVSIRLHDRPVA